MMVPFDYEGSDSDTVGYVLALSEIAYSCASTAVVMSVHNSIVCESILNFGTEDQKQHYLKDLAMGKYIGAFALTEPEAGSDPVSQQTTAVKDGEHYHHQRHQALHHHRQKLRPGHRHGQDRSGRPPQRDQHLYRHQGQPRPGGWQHGRQNGPARLGYHRPAFRGLPGTGSRTCWAARERDLKSS